LIKYECDIFFYFSRDYYYLSEGNISVIPPKVQVYTYMFGLWVRSDNKIWPLERRKINFKKNIDLSSMGRGGA